MYNQLKLKHSYPIQTRRKAVENIIQELKSVKAKQNPRMLRFIDSIFTSDRKWLLAFLKRYRCEIDIPFICDAHFNLLDEEIIMELKSANCHNLMLGIESGNDFVRNNVLGKKIEASRILAISKLLQKHNLAFGSLNMMGMPEERFYQAIQTIRINQKIRPDYLFVELFMPYPGLDITKRALAKDLLDDEKLTLLSSRKHKMMRSLLSQKDICKVSNLHKFSIWLVRFPFLEPLVRFLVLLPENRIFDYLYAFSLYVEFKKYSGFSFFKTLSAAFRNFKALN